MSVILGIDFGSWSCRTAVYRNGQLEPVQNRFAGRALPWQITSPPDLRDTVFPFVFRSLRQELGSLEPFQTVGGEHSVGDKIADVLGQVREDVASVLDEPITGAVISVPGFFPESPRAALREAAFNAGFDSVRLLDESMAAVVGVPLPREQGTLLVYALGAGSFSATVVSLENGRPRMLSCEGDRLLGGNAFDSKLAGLILSRIGREDEFIDWYDAATRLQKLAQEVKCGLTRREEEMFDLDQTALFGKGQSVRLGIRRSEFEEVILGSINQTIELSCAALDSAGVTSAEIDLVMLVGDSVRIPLVEQRLAALFTCSRLRTNDASVARGAAWFGGKLGERDWMRREPAVVEPVPPVFHANAATPGRPRSEAQRREVPAADCASWLDDFAPFLAKGEALWNDQDRGGSIMAVEAMLAHTQSYLGTLCLAYGQALFASADYDKANGVLAKALQYTSERTERARITSKYHLSLNRRAQQLANSERWDEAMAVIRDAIRVDSTCEGCVQLAAHIKRAMKASALRNPRKKRR